MNKLLKLANKFELLLAERAKCKPPYVLIDDECVHSDDIFSKKDNNKGCKPSMKTYKEKCTHPDDIK